MRPKEAAETREKEERCERGTDERERERDNDERGG